MKILLVVLLMNCLLIHTGLLNGQHNTKSEKPVVGQPIPPFSLKHVTHYRNKTATNEDFRGKWLFLDFWFPGCRPCIQSFPKVNEFQREFRDELNWVMVGISTFSRIEETFERIRAQKGLELISAYDSLLKERWGVYAMPHILVVDPSGIVRAITDGRDLTKERIRSLIQGNKVKLRDSEQRREEFDAFTLYDSSRLRTIITGSVLTTWDGEKQSGAVVLERWLTWPESYHRSGLNFSMVPLHALYNYAYFGREFFDARDTLYGKYWHKPWLEISDKRPFDYDFTYDVGKGTYNYNLIVPENRLSASIVMGTVKHDLKRAFGYEVTIETRQVPAWVLVADKSAYKKLRTKGGAMEMTHYTELASGFSVRNFPGNELIDLLKAFLYDDTMPFVDATGIDFNVDMHVDAYMHDMDQVQRELERYNLSFVKQVVPMKVLVFRDGYRSP